MVDGGPDRIEGGVVGDGCGGCAWCVAGSGAVAGGVPVGEGVAGSGGCGVGDGGGGVVGDGL